MTAAPAICVARARLNDLDDADLLAERLTPGELARLKTLPLARRRLEHLASRVLLKYLFLDRRSGARCSEPSLHDIGAGTLAEFSAASYREVEVVRPVGGAGPPRLFWRGAECRDLHASIAHSAGWTAVCLSARGRIGIDVAAVDDHVPSFYRLQFSPREREWVSGGGGRAAKRALHTLLWTLKESVVKTGAFPEATLWGYDEIEVLVDASAGAVAASYDTLNTGVLAPLRVRVPLAGGARVWDAWFSRTTDTLLSFVTLEPSAA